MTLRTRLLAALDANRGVDPAILAGDPRDLIDAGAAVVPAAVLIAIVDRPEPGVILTVRNAAMRKHPGQIAFPGGRIDPDDAGPVAAALREAEEEVALPRAAVDVLGTLDTYLTVTGYHIVPVIVVVPPDLPLVRHDAEVADWFEAPLAHLIEPANHIACMMDWNGSPRPYHEIVWQDHRIWGATAAMLMNLRRRLGRFA